jgi:hypothetical protein
MKQHSLLWATACLALLVEPGRETAYSAPAETNSSPRVQLADTNGIPQSDFTIPASPKQGRDPFFPNSSRWLGSSAQPQQTAPTRSDLVVELQGISGAPDHRLALINCRSEAEAIYRTLATGEETDIKTPSGRVRVRCLEIKSESVVVEVGGERRELRNPRVTH